MSQQAEETKQKKRAISLEELGQRLGRVFLKEEIMKGLAFQPRETDVVITPFAKCGTTWLQQIVHTLRTRGDMDFDDISRVVPWIETSAGLGINLDLEQRANPRAFKSHLPYGSVPKGGKYIVSCRNPGDALYSFYKFMEGWFLEPGAVSLDDFAVHHFIKSRDYWTHLKSWWEQKEQPNVLFLAYEQMLKNPTVTIKQVAQFIDIPLDDALLVLTLEHSSIDFMLKYVNRFDDAMIRKLSEEKCDLPSGSDSAKVRQGTAGAHKQNLSPHIIAELDNVWNQEITQPLGFKNYEAMITALR